MPILQSIPTVPGAPWWLILILFAVAPALWKVTTYFLERMDARRTERNTTFKDKDNTIKELYDRLLTDGQESREALSTAAKTMEGFVDKKDTLEAKLDHVINELQLVVEYVKRNDAA